MAWRRLFRTRLNDQAVLRRRAAPRPSRPTPMSARDAGSGTTLLGLSVPPIENSPPAAALMSAMAAAFKEISKGFDGEASTLMLAYKSPDPRSLKMAALVPSFALSVAASVETSNRE